MDNKVIVKTSLKRLNSHPDKDKGKERAAAEIEDTINLMEIRKKIKEGELCFK